MNPPKLIPLDGRLFTIAELSALTGIGIKTLHARLYNGWTPEQAVTIPTPTQRRRGVLSNLPELMGTGGGMPEQETSEIRFTP